MNSKKIQLSTIAIAIVVIACFVIDIGLKNWEKRDRVIEWDIHSHYAYLPAKFIYSDMHLKKSDYRLDENYYMFWPGTTPDGKKFIKTTMGMSILYAPFFFVAHAFTSFTDYPDNGFSEPYKIFLLLSSVFYLFIGLDFLRKILKHYNFSDAHTALTLLLVGLGTNLLCYASQSAPMPHVYNFFLFAVFIFYTIKWYERQSIKNTIILGLVFGLICLIRPTNGLISVFFVFYGISNLADLKQRLSFLRREWFLINVIFFFAFVVWIPQFVYWKNVTGNYLFYAYTDEGFFFNNPHIIEGLFSFRKGWLLYTPMMAFALIGIFYMRGALKKLILPTVLFLIINIYVIFSWWCWWYGGCYGQRGMVDCYPILAISFASFVQHLSRSRLFYRIAFASIAVFFIWLNIFQTFQFEYFSLHWDGMTKELYFKQFGKMDKIDGYDQYVKSPDYEAAKRGKVTLDSLPVLSDTKDIVNRYGGKKEISREFVHFRASNGKFLCADQKIKNAIVANRDNAYAWETFALIGFGDDMYAIRSYDNHFLCAEIDQHGEVTASRAIVNKWETFTMVKLNDNTVAFKATNDKYLTFDEKTFQLFASADSIGIREKFRLIKKVSS